MKKLVLTKLTVIMALCLALTACSNDTMDAHSAQVGRMGDMSIIDMRSAVVNNLLVAQATLQNGGNKPVTGYYRCSFFDANKMQVGDTQIWQATTIYPNDTQAIKCMATQLEATDFKVEFSADGKNVSVYNYK
jgi:uncharacterized protein YcfL